MDTCIVLAFALLEKIDAEFKQFTGSNHAFARTVMKRYGLRVSFSQTASGVVVSVDYDDMIQLFEAMEKQYSPNKHIPLPNSWQDGQ
jgi:hypothetical protein